jgi:hypothetical protein
MDDEPCRMCGNDLWLDLKDRSGVVPCRHCAAGRLVAQRMAKRDPRAGSVLAYDDEDVIARPPDEPAVRVDARAVVGELVVAMDQRAEGFGHP